MVLVIKEFKFDGDALSADDFAKRHCFEFTLSFTVDKEEEHIFAKFMGWFPISHVVDPKKFDEQHAALKMVFSKRADGFSDILWEGPEPTEVYQHSFMKGGDFIYREEDAFVFNEFFTINPVTLAIVEELRMFVTNAEHTSRSDFAPISINYFAVLLENLSLHWD